MGNKKKKHKRICPCGSRKHFEECCEYPKQGETPKHLKELITVVVKESFRVCQFPRGELCLYSSYLTKYLLEIFEIRSYVVAGSSKWKYYPNYFQFKPEAKMREFHAWLVTEYGEIVDLTCDDFEGRTDSHIISGVKYGIQAPKTCWSKVLTDRDYIAHDIGAKIFNIDDRALNMLKEASFKLLNEI